ncbi:hypothetical protein D3C81_1720660 [compost metagenome]
MSSPQMTTMFGFCAGCAKDTMDSRQAPKARTMAPRPGGPERRFRTLPGGVESSACIEPLLILLFS